MITIREEKADPLGRSKMTSWHKEALMEKVKVGDRIKIIEMKGEPQYTNREGVVTHISTMLVKYMELGEGVPLFQNLMSV